MKSQSGLERFSLPIRCRLSVVGAIFAGALAASTFSAGCGGAESGEPDSETEEAERRKQYGACADFFENGVPLRAWTSDLAPPSQLALFGGRIFSGPVVIEVMNDDGSNAHELGRTTRATASLVVDSDGLFFVEPGPRILRLPLTGGTISQVDVEMPESHRDIVSRASSQIMTTDGADVIWQTPGLVARTNKFTGATISAALDFRTVYQREGAWWWTTGDLRVPEGAIYREVALLPSIDTATKISDRPCALFLSAGDRAICTALRLAVLGADGAKINEVDIPKELWGGALKVLFANEKIAVLSEENVTGGGYPSTSMNVVLLVDLQTKATRILTCARGVSQARAAVADERHLVWLENRGSAYSVPTLLSVEY